MRLELAIKFLTDRDIICEQKSKYHLVVEGNDGMIDFWPTAGKWIPRGNNYTPYFGIMNLYKHIKGIK